MVSQSDRIRIGIVGTGRMARIHAENIKNHLLGFELRSVTSRSLDRAARFAQEFGIVTHSTLVPRTELDAILIATDPATHPSWIADATCSAAKHIFCEKPIGLTIDAIQIVLKVVEGCGVKLFVGFNRRFDPHFKTAIGALRRDSGIGDPGIVSIISHDPKGKVIVDPAMRKGMLFFGTAVHDFDMARHIFGDEAVTVHTMADILEFKILKDRNDVDTAITTLQFRNGGLAIISNSWVGHYYDQRLEILGSRRMLAVGNMLPHAVVTADNGMAQLSVPRGFFAERYQESYLAELQEFERCIREDKEPLVTGHDGLMAVVLATAAKISAETGRTVYADEMQSWLGNVG
ncbi:MAG: Gfo/Idh/MocA family oxidoreductase [Patescibacteria group bacterium]